MTPPSNAFIFAPHFNEPPDAHNPHGNDSTGAFQPGAQQFARWCQAQGGTATRLLFNNHATSRRDVFNEIKHGLIAAPPLLDAVVYFGHGIPDAMVSARVGPSVLDDFASAVRANSRVGVKVILYACSCAAPGGLAAKLAERLSVLNATVYGHEVEGHAFRNPILRRFPGVAQVCPEGMGTPWRAALQAPGGTLWMRAPFMSGAELRAELAGAPSPAGR